MAELNWSILDPNTPAKIAGSYQQGQANRLAMQQAGQEREANALELQSKRQAMNDEQSVRQAYAQSGGDPNKLAESLRGAGQHQKAYEVQGQLVKEQAAQRKAKIEEALQHVTVLGQIVGNVRDQASYDVARQQVADIYGPESAAKLPPAYDPNAVSQFRNQSMTESQQLEQQWKGLDHQLKQDQFSFDRQKFGAQQSMESQKFGAQQSMERQKMAQSAGQFAQSQWLEREKMRVAAEKQKEEKPLTEAQGKATGFAARAAESDAVIGLMAKAGTNQGGMIKQFAESVPFAGERLGTLANITQSDPQQQVDQAQRNFINAVLRQESGAVISDVDFSNAQKQYFVQRGDGDKVIAQKEKNRATAIKALEVQSGPGLERMGGASAGWTVEEH